MGRILVTIQQLVEGAKCFGRNNGNPVASGGSTSTNNAQKERLLHD